MPMVGTHKPTKSTYRWLTILVLLVITGLASLGVISLRQDRGTAEQDARLLAETLADALARESSAAIAEAIQLYTIQTEEFRNGLLKFAYGEAGLPQEISPLLGRMLEKGARARFFIRDPARFPFPDHRDVPETPDWLLAAPREVLEQFELAERHAREGELSTARIEFKTVADADFPPLQALAELRLTELDDADPRAAVGRLRRLASQFPETRTPGGLAIGELALLRAVELSPPEALGELIQEVISRATFHPGFLSERLFTSLEQRVRGDVPGLKVRVAAARAVWSLEWKTRDLLDGWRDGQGIRPGLFHAESSHGSFLLLCAPSSYAETNVSLTAASPVTNVVQGTDFVVTLVPFSVADAAARKAAAELGPRWPRYLSAEVELSNRRIGVTPWLPGVTHRWDARPEFAHRSDLISFADRFPFAISVRLADPDLLYAKQRQRVWLFGGVILLAAGLAGAGAWQLQRHLAAQVRLNDLKSNFVSSVSHELRAPIASVRLMAESLERGKVQDEPKRNEYFRFIVQECRRLSSLIENVLDFSRIEQGRKQYEFEPTDIVTLVQQTVKLMEPYAVERGIQLKSEIRNPKSEMEVDGRAIQQALVNLIDNAIKHSPKGETVVVVLECEQRRTGVAPVSNLQSGSIPETELTKERNMETAATAVLLSVSDHGPGIPASEHEKIFERFYRLGSELRRETQGVGIGLSIVKHIVEAHGGRVTLKSEVGKGSRFTIELPGRTETTDGHG
jgi:signal transduction histidine kinase